MFDRFISIDWSGAGTETERGDLRIVNANLHDGRAMIVNPTSVGARSGTKRWTREECRRYLARALSEQRGRCLVAMDFGFGYPKDAAKTAFCCDGWEEMLRVLSHLYSNEETARATATRVNLSDRFGGHGPYRFDDNRSDFRFYLNNGTPYYRLVEMAVPQAISQWYLGSGGTVGFSSITGMAALHHLIEKRRKGEVDFRVWPQEGLMPEDDKHVIVESYPAIYCEPQDYGLCTDEHCQDAWRVLQWMRREANDGTMESHFRIESKPFGRVETVSFEEQIRFEGWIFGVSRDDLR